MLQCVQQRALKLLSQDSFHVRKRFFVDVIMVK